MVGGECEKMVVVLIDFASLFRGGQGGSRDAPLSSQPVPMLDDGTSDAGSVLESEKDESEKDVRGQTLHHSESSFSAWALMGPIPWQRVLNFRALTDITAPMICTVLQVTGDLL